MKIIKNNVPWVLNPSIICEAFPVDPITNYINGDHNWEVLLECTLNQVEEGDSCLLSILPSYIALDIHKKQLFFTITYFDDTTEYIQVPVELNNKMKLNISIKHIPNRKLAVFIDNIEKCYFNLKEKPTKGTISSSIVISSNTIKNTAITKRADISITSFKVKLNDEVKADHSFNEYIFNKSIDKTGNLNFLHTYYNGE